MTEAQWRVSSDPQAMLKSLCDSVFVGSSGADGISPISGGPRVSDRKLRLFVAAILRLSPNWYRDYGESRRVVEDMVRWAEEGIEPPKDDWNTYLPDGERRKETAVETATHMVNWGPGLGLPLSERAHLLRDIVGNPFADPAWLIYRCPLCGQEEHWNFRGSDDAAGEWLWCPDCDVEMRHRRDLWRTPAVLMLARAAYEETRDDGTLDADRLAVLSDALEEAGCDCVDVLRHLRGWERCPECLGQWDLTSVGLAGHSVRPVCGNCKRGWIPLRGPHVLGMWSLDLILGKD